MQEALQEHLELMQKDGDVILNLSPMSAIIYDTDTETVHEVKVELQHRGTYAN